MYLFFSVLLFFLILSFSSLFKSCLCFNFLLRSFTFMLAVTSTGLVTSFIYLQGGPKKRGIKRKVALITSFKLIIKGQNTNFFWSTLYTWCASPRSESFSPILLSGSGRYSPRLRCLWDWGECGGSEAASVTCNPGQGQHCSTAALQHTANQVSLFFLPPQYKAGRPVAEVTAGFYTNL